ncbi:MAG: hypothetical protein M1819_004581 [Sarea resinae]|nr:MAG: hypothetical protein M1819_006815 [Sarea resinae]KAI9832037.1 MAG: hypothetical protein M1819_004581 [Sarea resinae]
MPELRGVTVHVTTSDGKALQEWSPQHFRRHNKVSCYIQSETNVSFRVSIQPKLPLIADDTPAAHAFETLNHGPDKLGFLDANLEDMDEGKDEDQCKWPSSLNNCDPPKYNLQVGLKLQGGKRSKTLSPVRIPIPGQRGRNPTESLHPPFHLLASLYLDGREKPERKLIIYLDPEDEEFNEPDGMVVFKTRWVEGKDGKLREHVWLFQDVGIEASFDKMLISAAHSSAGDMLAQDEDELIEAMNFSASLKEGEKTNVETSKAGQIVVKLERIQLGTKSTDHNFRAKHKEGELDDVDMAGAEKDITHTTGFGQTSLVKGSKNVRIVTYSPFKKGEGPFATFQFFYRSEEKLRTFNFEGFPREKAEKAHRAAGNAREMNVMLSKYTPLNIAHPQTSAKKVDPDKTFDEKVRKGIRPKGKDPEIDFGSEYRESTREDLADNEGDPFTPSISHKELVSIGQRRMKGSASRQDPSSAYNSNGPDTKDKAKSNLVMPFIKSKGPMANFLKKGLEGSDYRLAIGESDADDEAESDEGNGDSDLDEILDLSDNEQGGNIWDKDADEDDHGLPGQLTKVMLGKRTRHHSWSSEDDGDNVEVYSGLPAIIPAHQAPAHTSNSPDTDPGTDLLLDQSPPLTPQVNSFQKATTGILSLSNSQGAKPESASDTLQQRSEGSFDKENAPPLLPPAPRTTPRSASASPPPLSLDWTPVPEGAASAVSGTDSSMVAVPGVFNVPQSAPRRRNGKNKRHKSGRSLRQPLLPEDTEPSTGTKEPAVYDGSGME